MPEGMMTTYTRPEEPAPEPEVAEAAPEGAESEINETSTDEEQEAEDVQPYQEN